MGRRLGGEALYDCKSCAERPALYVMLGHDGPPSALYKENLINGEKLERCPLRTLQLADPSLVAEINRHVNEYYPFFEDGYLLEAGGLADQPARYLAYMQEIRRLKGRIDAKAASLNGEETE